MSAAEALVRVTPGAVDFGDVSVGLSAASSVDITNPSATSSLVISQISVSGKTFSLASAVQLPISIPAGGTHTLMVGFTPASTDAYSGQITMMDASAKPIAQVSMDGRGAHTRNPQLTISASSLSFGSEAVDTAKTLSLTLTSSGTSAVKVSSDSITGKGFTIIGGTLPATLNPKQAVTLQVQFEPTTAGAVAGELTINSNSTNGGTTQVALSGTGTAANPQLTISASSLSFGSEAVDTAKTLSLTLTSSGTSAATVSSDSITGKGFTIVAESFPVILNPKQAVTLQVQFEPTTAGAVAG
ncbi:choice-of-anchor D domain-containing protein, partial [Granulicella sp. L60]|uniref:choice-of-anchor D domain-containing protein n=1 Tax=Granulicella sp. L60 TaxID=1641866 RepID=UPI001C20BC52